MAYQALARKWRPRTLTDMVGQEPILRMLTNALTQKRIHHAYLLTGTRGVGKTTLARILAKCLNCESDITPTPCDQCPTCQAINQGQFLDLYEIDAASRTKVEDTRDLLENVLYPPTAGRYKIYLIDEVHMLSNHSFNALLKTLEEPPAHVKFLLATTDPKKIPITILSRCLQFHLRRINPPQITQHLQHICAAEKITYETEALEKIAKAADGSMRDALSLLDQAIAYGQGGVKNADVHTMLGSMSQDDLLPMLAALAAQDGKQLFALITNLAEHAPDFQSILEEWINLLHQIAIAQIVPAVATQAATIQQLAKTFTPEEIQLYYQIALLGRRDLAFAPSPQQGFEMTMLRMLAFKPSIAPTKTTTAPAPTFISKNITPSEITAEAKIEKEKIEPAPVVASAAFEWRDILPKLELNGMAYALASNCILEKIQDNLVILALSATHQPMLNTKLKDRITEALSRFFNRPMQLVINITTEEIVTPTKQVQQEKEHQLTNATQKVLQHPEVQKLIEMYDATVEVTLI